MLLQGILLPTPPMSSQEPLPPAKELLTEPLEQRNAIVLTDPADSTGLAKVRRPGLPFLEALAETPMSNGLLQSPDLSGSSHVSPDYRI